MTSNNNDEKSDDFRSEWAFPSEVRTTIPGAGLYEVRQVPGAYKSGRPKFECYFLSIDKKRIIATRLAMQLTSSKTGSIYFVCRRQDNTVWKKALASKVVDELLAARGVNPTVAAVPRAFSLDDVLADIERS
jgi:hypothetical protein